MSDKPNPVRCDCRYCEGDSISPCRIAAEDEELLSNHNSLRAKLALTEKQLEEQRIHLRGLLKVADEGSAQVALARVKKGLQGYLELMENGWEIAPEPLPIPELRLKLALAVEALEEIRKMSEQFSTFYTLEVSEKCDKALAKIRS